MRKIATILILFLCSIIYSQSNPVYFKLDVPDFIPVNNKFEISVVTNLMKLDADSCEVYLFIENNLSVNKAFVLTRTAKTDFTLTEDNQSGYFDNSYKFRLNLSDTVFKSNSPLQIRYEIDPTNALNSEIGFKYLFFKDNEVIYNISSFEEFDTDQYEEPVYVNFYKPDFIEGKKLRLKESEYLNLDLPDKIDNNRLLLSFWTKINGVGSQLINVKTEMNESLFAIELNRFEVLSLITENYFEIYNDLFIAPNSWNFIILEYLKDEKVIRVYCNKRKIFSIETDLLNEAENIKIGGIGNVELESLNMWDFGNNLELINSNMNYSYFEADSSKILKNYNFNDQKDLEVFNKQTDAISKEFELLDSEVPIFSRLPILDAKLNNNYYLLEWSNKEIEDVDKFILQRSSDGIGFEEIYEVEGTGNKEKIYSFADDNKLNSELIYYRIKQINSDSSTVFSNQIKIGQGEKEIFRLEQNYPNPFNPVTTINVEMFETREVEVTVFNLVGNRIEKLHKGVLAQGIHEFNFDGTNLTSGIYFIEVKTDKVTRAKKMILTK